MLVPTPTLLKLLLANEVQHAAAGPFSGAFDGLKVALATNVLPTGVDIVFATDVDQPVYTTYADQTATFGAVYLRDDGAYGLSGGLLTFQPTADPATPQQIAGYALILPGAPNVVYGVENFDVPKDLTTALDAVKIVPEIALKLTSLGGAAIVN